ncbi:hypothetical protein JCM19275_1744 [Nonlabens ulvanivorans]|uniref:Uncharacterized protein n=1 Tax=Nonlabens ulvanivorans TaxID=906888 RepID=A0A090WI00_NONUL|nr:hypothetical protein [Nonlabens ulvanivorans]GAL76596.1 hypothetical protein JCM19275_1744 [Nonlabens ulvanivorans]
MKKLISLSILIFFLNSCSKRETKIIDLKSFTIEVPSDFKYHPYYGIDSFVGEISNGKSTFSFDYGYYGGRPTLNSEQFIQANSNKLDSQSYWLFVKLIDTEPFKNSENNKVDRSLVEFTISDLKLNPMSNDIVLDVYPKTKCDYYYSVKFKGKHYSIPFFAFEKNKKLLAKYDIKIDTVDRYVRTISLLKERNDSITKASTLHMIPIKYNSPPYPEFLKMTVISSSNLDKREIERIFKSVTMKTNDI